MKRKNFILALFLAVLLLPIEAQQFMKVAAEPVITENNQRCFLIKQGYSRKDSTEWVLFCGKIINFFYEQGYEYTLHVDKFDPQAPVIRVINTIGRDNSESYLKRMAQEALKKEKEKPKEQDQTENANVQIDDQALSKTEDNATQVEDQTQEEYNYYEEYDYEDFNFDDYENYDDYEDNGENYDDYDYDYYYDDYY